jgi:tetratricopeptide (TPR) repeat protein
MAYTQQTPIGTPDVNLITKTLASLQPDSALQQYAALHKNNPYILSLAKSESDRRKSLRTAAQGNPGQMPTVADREIAGMATPVMTGSGGTLQTGYGGPVMTGMASGGLPEDQGIAQIPTPNMQRMADGGIAGYEDDEEGMATGGMGGMFNFAQQSEPVVRMSGGGVPGYAAGVYNEERFKDFLKKEGKTSEFANASPKERQRILTEFADKTSGPQKAAAPAASTAPTSSVKAAATPEDPRLLRKISEKVGSGAAKVLKKAGPAGLGIQALSSAGDYKIQSPDNIDTSLMGTLRDVGQGEFGRAAKGLGLGLAELGMDAGSFGANMLDYVVPGKAPVSTAYEKLLKRNIDDGYTLQGPSDRVVPPQVKPPAAEVAAPAPEAAPAPGAAPNTGGVADLLPSAARLDTSYMPAAAAAPTAADAKAKAGELYDSKGQIRSLEGKQAQARQDILNQRDERLAQLDAFNKAQGPAFASYEKMLQKEELQDATDKEKSGLMSLMKGFLAMAAGESPNAATNIAKGAMVGMGDYGDALKEFKKAAKERTKAMADIENARRAEAKGDFKDTQMYTDRANERLADSADRFTGLISQITGKESDVAASLFNNMTNNAEETSRMMIKERGLNARAASSEARADARALMPTGEARTAMMLGTGNTQAERLKSGMMVLQELSTDKSGAKTVETLAKINSDRAKNGEAPISMADLVNSAREYSALMYPKVGNDAPTRAR